MASPTQMFRRPSPRWLVAGASIAIVLAVNACGGTPVTQTAVGGAPAAAAGAGVGTRASAAPASVQQVTLHAKEFSFTPNSVQLKLGQLVQLTIVNDGTVDHDIKSAIPISGLKYQSADNPADEQADNAAQGVFDVDYNQGHTAQITFVPTKAGTYQFYCDVPGHREAGMTGTFVVQD
jgi:uncharacterized cupredoxin-like copper-binding protein